MNTVDKINIQFIQGKYDDKLCKSQTQSFKFRKTN